MFAVIAIIGPSIIGLKLLDYLLKGLSKKNIIYYFVILLTLSLALNNAISYLVFNITDIFTSLNAFPIYFSKYITISLIINIVLSLLWVVIIKNVSLKIEVERIETDEQKPKKTKKNSKLGRKIFKKNKDK